jgi:non-heme chloroperoxidase
VIGRSSTGISLFSSTARTGLGRRSHRASWISSGAGARGAYDSVKAFSETDFTEDLKKFDIPTLVMHGEDDQIVPVKDSARKSARLIRGAKEIYYPGAPHGLTATLQDQVNKDLLAFLKNVAKTAAA